MGWCPWTQTPPTLIQWYSNKLLCPTFLSPSGHSTWGFPKSWHDKVLGQFKIHYIRVFQPENLYTDMEPVYPPLPVEAPDPGPYNRRTCS